VKRLILTLAVLVISPAAYAHGGGLNAQGCHNNRKTGDYHCHRPQQTVQRPSPPPAQPQAPQSNYTPTTAFANCAAARAAGRAPVRRGEPGYGPHLDRDNDGIGCE